ncbi:hypothetical protein B0H14DRAFT_2806478 [Mycena olivaceomarginata]|nr:hypothetical protein B0H14DRAFT_2806478 [Mycena olivaceomarginata]
MVCPRPGSYGNSKFVSTASTLLGQELVGTGEPAPLTFRHPGTYAGRTGPTPARPPFQSTAGNLKGAVPLGAATVPLISPAGPAGLATRFTRRTRSAYLGTSSIIIIPTTRAPVIALRAVREDEICDEPAPPTKVVYNERAPLTKGVRRTQSTPTFTLCGGANGHSEIEPDDLDTTPLLGHAKRLKSKPSFGIMSVKYGGAVDSSTGVGNGPRPVSQRSSRVRPISGYFNRADVDWQEELEDMPEVREALQVNASIRAMGYRYERLEQPRRESMDQPAVRSRFSGH